MTDNSTVMLCAGRLTLELSPSTGGSISALRWDGERPLLRACNTSGENVLDAASFTTVFGLAGILEEKRP